MKSKVVAFVSLILLAAAATAGATPTFPGDLQKALNLPFHPQCTLCHSSAAGGGAVVTSFGRALLARGLAADDTASLDAALAQLTKDKVNSDRKNGIDTLDLQNGIDPSTGAPADSVPSPEYGCGAQLAGTRSPGFGALGLVFGVGLLAAVRRRRQSGGTRP